MTYTVLGTLEYGPIRARSPWQGLVALVVGGGVGRLVGREKEEAAEERGFPGSPRTARSQPASSELEGSRGTVLAELPDGFLPRLGRARFFPCCPSLAHGFVKTVCVCVCVCVFSMLLHLLVECRVRGIFFSTRDDDYSFRTF